MSKKNKSGFIGTVYKHAVTNVSRYTNHHSRVNLNLIFRLYVYDVPRVVLNLY